MQEPVTIHLDDNHENGRTAVLRGFVRVKDRQRVQRAILNGKNYTEDELKKSSTSEFEMTISGGSLIDYTEAQVKALLLEYNGDRTHPFELLMDAEDNGDYDKISEAAAKIFGKYENPKG